MGIVNNRPNRPAKKPQKENQFLKPKPKPNGPKPLQKVPPLATKPRPGQGVLGSGGGSLTSAESRGGGGVWGQIGDWLGDHDIDVGFGEDGVGIDVTPRGDDPPPIGRPVPDGGGIATPIADAIGGNDTWSTGMIAGGLAAVGMLVLGGVYVASEYYQ